MSKFHFKDSSTEKSKNIIFQFKPEDDILLKLPDKSGTIVTTNTINRFLQGNDAGNFIQYIKKPNITENNAGIVNPDGHNKPLLVASYRTSDMFVGQHENTEWEVSYDASFETIAIRHNNQDDKLQWLPNVPDLGRQVYVRYRFTSRLEDVIVRSQWSDTIAYRTPRYGAIGFTVTVSGQDVLAPTIRSGELRLFGEDELGVTNHIYTKIRVYNARSGITVHEKTLGAIREYTLPRYTLKKLTEYKVEVIYGTDNDKMPETQAISVVYKTPDVYITQPAVMYEVNGSNHSLVIKDPVIINSIDTHVSTSWEVRKIVGDIETPIITLTESNEKLKLNITNLTFDTVKSYKVYVKVHSESMESNVTSLDFDLKLGDVYPVVINVTESSDKLPIIKLSGYRIVNDNDEIEAITISTTIRYGNGSKLEIVEGHSKQYPNVNGKFQYNTPITINLTENEYIQWFLEDEGPGAREFVIDRKYIPNANDEFTFLVKAIIHGKKYQTETSLFEFRHTLDNDTDMHLTGHDVNNLRISTNSQFNTAWLRKYLLHALFIVYNRKDPNKEWTYDNYNFIHNIKRTVAEGFQNVPIPASPPILYDQEYRCNFIYVTSLGRFNIGTHPFTIDSLRITAPTVNVSVNSISSNKMEISVTGSSYSVSPSGRPNSQHANTYLKIVDADNTNIVVHEEKLGSVTSWRKAFTVSTNGMRYNKTFIVKLVYESASKRRSPEGIKSFNTGAVPVVTIRTPTVNATLNQTTINATTSSFYVTGIEDKSHKATNWYIKLGNNVVWSSLNDKSNLTSITITGVVNYGNKYTLEVSHVASDGTVSASGKKEINVRRIVKSDIIGQVEHEHDRGSYIEDRNDGSRWRVYYIEYYVYNKIRHTWSDGEFTYEEVYLRSYTDNYDETMISGPAPDPSNTPYVRLHGSGSASGTNDYTSARFTGSTNFTYRLYDDAGWEVVSVNMHSAIYGTIYYAVFPSQHAQEQESGDSMVHSLSASLSLSLRIPSNAGPAQIKYVSCSWSAGVSVTLRTRSGKTITVQDTANG